MKTPQRKAFRLLRNAIHRSPSTPETPSPLRLRQRHVPPRRSLETETPEAFQASAPSHPSEAAGEAGAVHLPRGHVARSLQLDVGSGGQGGHAAHGRLHGAGGEVHRSRDERLGSAPAQAPSRDGKPAGLLPLFSPRPLGALVRNSASSSRAVQ